MPSAKSITSKINAALRKVGPPVRQVYKRTFTVTGSANAKLLGRTTKTHTDVLMNPQPMYTQVLQRSPVHMQRPSALDGVKTTGDKQGQAGVYEFLVSADSMTLDELKSGTVQLVLVDADGTQDALTIEHYDKGEWQGAIFAFNIYAVSVSRT